MAFHPFEVNVPHLAYAFLGGFVVIVSPTRSVFLLFLVCSVFGGFCLLRLPFPLYSTRLDSTLLYPTPLRFAPIHSTPFPAQHLRVSYIDLAILTTYHISGDPEPSKKDESRKLDVPFPCRLVRVMGGLGEGGMSLDEVTPNVGRKRRYTGTGKPTGTGIEDWE
jgi:hypothetical protein